MRFKIVARVLDAAGALLGWGEIAVSPRGDATLRSVSGPLVVKVDTSGEAHVISYHWADLNVQKRVPYPGGATALQAGQSVQFSFPDDVVLSLPSDEGPLPAVTVGASVVSVPVGKFSGA